MPAQAGLPPILHTGAHARASQQLLSPLSLAAYAVLGLIAYGQLVARSPAAPLWWACAATLALFVLMFVIHDLSSRHPRWGRSGPWLTVIGQMLAAMVNLSVVHDGMNAILLVLIAAQLPALMRLPLALVLMLALNLGLFVLLSQWHDVRAPLFTASVFATFQVFALMMGHYAHRAEQASAELTAVNAHLLATRHLLAEGVRDGERLRLSRELHDVAGHALTALKLHLELAVRLPDPEQRQLRVQSAQVLVDRLLDDIRGVVGQLRRHDGIDVPAALTTLAAGHPGIDIDLDVEPGLRVADMDRAATLLRIVQEGLTNAIRHGQARHIAIRVEQDANELVLRIEDRGRGNERIEEGNGLTGMRERVAEHGGSLAIESSRGLGTRLLVRLPDPGAAPA